MNRSNVLLVCAAVFSETGEDEWGEIVDGENWGDFLRSLNLFLRMGGSGQEADCWVNALSALENPPSFGEKNAFAARHFTGGLPYSALPIESLYRGGEEGEPTERGAGMYWGDSARYMRDLVRSMGMTIPDDFRACPDHLSIELEMAAALLEAGLEAQAADFMANRFSWLEAYEARLADISEDASFYEAISFAVFRISALWPQGDAGNSLSDEQHR